MAYLDFESRYDKWPETRIEGFDNEAWRGYDAIGAALQQAMQGRRILVIDCYPGVNDAEVLSAIQRYLKPQHVIESKELFFESDILTEKMQFHLTQDRVRGVMYYGTISDFIDPERLEAAQKTIATLQGTVLVYGFGASLVAKGDLLVYADMARWQIQLRYRKGMPNYKQHNEKEEALLKYKRGFFVEWRIADRHKRKLYDRMDYYLDTNTQGDPKMVIGRALLQGLDAITCMPFRLVPYFDPGVWGGQWMKEVCDLDQSSPNYAWSFDGVPEENSLYLRYGDVRIETPAMNLVQYHPRRLLGEKTFSRFGAEFPIRFDFLDTIGGQNLSLQVHPLTEYIKSRFGMPYTQDESYYILDTETDEGGVYLGVQKNIDPEEMIRDLEIAQAGGKKFEAERYVNLFPAKKHDHFLIPAGTVHCSSKGCMILEISATPYIFTFKLWDWDRVDFNGIPRPIHIEDGKEVIQYERDTDWVQEHLINHFETLYDGPDFTEIKTGLHEYEFIETHVFTTKNQITIKSDGEVAMLNLVEGQAAVIESPHHSFEPFTVHYVETFIVPAQAGDYTIRPEHGGEQIKILKANVRYA